MKELSIKEKVKRYDEALEKSKRLYEQGTITESLCYVFPELKESEDEKIKKCVKYAIDKLFLKEKIVCDVRKNDVLAWLEKQGNTNEPINRDKFAQGVLRGAAINLITWIDYNAAEGNMCLSNMECKDIEDSLVNGNWDKIYAYIKKKLEKQSEQKPTIEMITPEESLGIDSETYNKIVDECIYSEQKPAEWSEGDEKILQDLIDHFEYKKEFTETADFNILLWLKSLKDKYTWKPSDEQLYWLKWAVNRMPDTEKANEAEAVLEDLLEQLKKLK